MFTGGQNRESSCIYLYALFPLAAQYPSDSRQCVYPSPTPLTMSPSPPVVTFAAPYQVLEEILFWDGEVFVHLGVDEQKIRFSIPTALLLCLRNGGVTNNNGATPS